MDNKRIELTTPLTDAQVAPLKAGDMAYVSGVIYTARDAAHLQLCQDLEAGKPMPFDFEGAIVYYAGPCPAKPGQPIGSVGPTTGGRMDKYSPRLIAEGLRFMIGKGSRDAQVISSIVKHKGVYFAAIGGAAALMGKCVQEAEVIAYDDLGPEAIRRLVVKDLPVIVAIDSSGADSYQKGREAYAQ